MYLTDHLAIKGTTDYKPKDMVIKNSDMLHEQ
jgi:hypothetical protein